ncbi:MAG: cyclic nucleotide-binding domain-containing protein [Nostoc sp.]|uniref:cyclic nucleotide-binding domain-containing protein n=1 Tax=Nostoc sp. TaxID=1180 RepID=UPI002FFA2D7E
MTEVLLEELLDSDINWIAQRGHKRRFSANQSIIQQGQPLDACYILLTGSLVAAVADSLATDPEMGQSLIQFSPGEIVGETAFFRSTPFPMTIRAMQDCEVLELPYPAMQARLSQDPAFASRFYRAIAILLLQRFEQVLSKFSRRRGLQISTVQDAPVFLGELHDSDVDWMIEQGTVEEAIAHQVLIQAGRAVEKLYVVLSGELAVAATEQKRSALNEIFSQLRGDDNEPSGRQILRVSRGEIAGETALLNSRLSNFIVKATVPSVLLSIPQPQLSLKLQQDLAMGARFYRVLAILNADRLEAFIDRLGYTATAYRVGQPLSSTVQYEDELNFDTLDVVNVGGARFDWMLQQLKVRGR